jgi:hypothetical protein
VRDERSVHPSRPCSATGRASPGVLVADKADDPAASRWRERLSGHGRWPGWHGSAGKQLGLRHENRNRRPRAFPLPRQVPAVSGWPEEPLAVVGPGGSVLRRGQGTHIPRPGTRAPRCSGRCISPPGPRQPPPRRAPPAGPGTAGAQPRNPHPRRKPRHRAAATRASRQPAAPRPILRSARPPSEKTNLSQLRADTKRAESQTIRLMKLPCYQHTSTHGRPIGESRDPGPQSIYRKPFLFM